MKRVASVALVLLAVAAVAGLFVHLSADDGGIPSTPPADGPWSCSEPCDRFTIAWGGDTFVGWAAQRRIDKHGMAKILKNAKRFIAADYSVINVEAPITTIGKGEAPDDPGNFFSYNMKPETAKDLADIGVDAVGLANNHTFDRGSQGVADSITHATAAGLRAFGVGSTRAEALAPLLIESPHGTVGVVAFAGGKSGAVGGGKKGFVALNAASAQEGLEAAKAAGARWVVAFVHWGANYKPAGAGQKKNASMLAATGYDLVVGHGPHIPQAVGIVDGTPVLYSIGNFVFHTKGRFQKIGVPSEMATATTYLGPEGFEAVELHCFQGDNRITKFRMPPCKPEQRAALWERMGPLVQPRGELGVVRF